MGFRSWLRVSTRARMFRPSTARVMRNTPAQASCCQFSYGLMANLKMVTGRLAIGSDRLEVKNWLFSAVNSSGAVSPAMRATASRMPVTTPARAARSVMLHDHLPLGRAQRVGRLAQRRRAPACSMFSVVRITTGMTISASAIDAGPAGELLEARHDHGVDEQADHDGGRRQQDVVDEARRRCPASPWRRTRPGRCRP